MLEVKHLRKKFGSTLAISDISFSLKPGIYVIAGPNGAGKTTLLRLIAGAILPSFGSIFYDNTDLLSDRASARRFSSYLSDQVPLYSDLSTEEHLLYRGRLRGLTPRRLRARIRHVTEALDLKPIFTKNTGSLSAGQRKRVGIADALLVDSRILTIDEPFACLDASHRKLVSNALAPLARHTTVLLATHCLEDVAPLFPTTLVLSSGSLAATLPPSNDPLRPRVSDALHQFHVNS